MIVASPCNNLAIMPMGVDATEMVKDGTNIKKSPTRYYFVNFEFKYFEILCMRWTMKKQNYGKH
jgi:hypothetical protein